jgi:hypothetical protein
MKYSPNLFGRCSPRTTKLPRSQSHLASTPLCTESVGVRNFCKMRTLMSLTLFATLLLATDTVVSKTTTTSKPLIFSSNGTRGSVNFNRVPANLTTIAQYNVSASELKVNGTTDKKPQWSLFELVPKSVQDKLVALNVSKSELEDVECK